ncbi:hypothetical protein EFK68_17505 [Pseudomonas aeruginosa]|nr:hypothetical protein EFK68_17505 [Pseudomonas aeruginosa]
MEEPDPGSMAGVQRRVELDGQIVGGDAEEQLSAVRLAAIGEQHQAKLGLREGRAACHPAEARARLLGVNLLVDMVRTPSA